MKNALYRKINIDLSECGKFIIIITRDGML